MPKEEESRPTSTPGFLDITNHYAFEQVKNSKYALPGSQATPKQSEPFLIDTPYVKLDGAFVPLVRAPWPLADAPLNYGNFTEFWNETKQFIWDHLFLPDENLYDVLNAWAFASWIPEVWSVVPYIFFYGPVASGKTRGLEVLHRLSFRTIISSNISSAALFRACEAWHPTLILDETEIYNKTEKNEVIGLLNSGYRRGQYAIRVKVSEFGEILECFDVFGFKAMAGTEALAKTLESRSIMIRMIKNRRKVRLHVDEKKADELRAKFLYWRLNQLDGRERDVICEDFLRGVEDLEFDNGRLSELFQCLLAISNDGRENILAYANKMVEMRQFEEQTSIEAEVVEAMCNDETLKENNVILTKDVADKLNANRKENEKFKTNSVGYIIRRLGFEPRHTRRGNGWFYDIDRLKYLQAIYLGEGVVAKPSLSSQTSRSMDVDGMESVKDVKDVNPLQQENHPKFTCWICRAGIFDGIYEKTPEGPAHVNCYQQLLEARRSESVG